MGALTVFWPIDIDYRAKGYLYGWKLGDTACVAGIINAEGRDQAKQLLQNIRGSLLQMSLAQSITLLAQSYECLKAGHLLLDEADVHSPSFVQYRPPSSHNLRFLTTNQLNLDFITVQSAATVPSTPFEPLQETLRHVNIVTAIRASATSDRKGPLKSLEGGKRIPIWPLELPLTMMLWILCHPLPVIGGGGALKDVSATAQQLDIRLNQAYSSPHRYRASRLMDLNYPERRSVCYINFYNILWLIANDIIIGSVISTILCSNSANIASKIISCAKFITIQTPTNALLWLNNWPAGLKLNLELGTFFCTVFISIIQAWDKYCLHFVQLHAETIVYFAGLAATFGSTMAISIALDILAILTSHLYLCYLISTFIFSWHTSVLYSLFNIFRGKKRNVLRDRVEPSHYELDQLLLGTILFTLAAFLFPTVLAFYLAFASARLIVIVLYAALETILASLNHFPLFALMLRIKDPARLPGGITFTVAKSKCLPNPTLHLQNKPIGFGAIFYQQLALRDRLAAHYSPSYLFRQLLTGRYLSPIPRSRLMYNTLENKNK